MLSSIFLVGSHLSPSVLWLVSWAMCESKQGHWKFLVSLPLQLKVLKLESFRLCLCVLSADRQRFRWASSFGPYARQSTAVRFSRASDERQSFHGARVIGSARVLPAKRSNLSPECPQGQGSHYRLGRRRCRQSEWVGQQRRSLTRNTARLAASDVWTAPSAAS